MVLFEFDKTFDFNDTNIIPDPNDLSFIGNKFFEESLLFDLRLFAKLGMDGCEALTNPHYPILDLKNQCYPAHTDFSFKRSLLCLRFIMLFGWTEFVIKIFNYNL